MLKAISHSLSIMAKDCSLVKNLAVSPGHIPKQILEILEQLLQTYGLTFKDWTKAQMSDSGIEFILNKVDTGSKAQAKQTLDQAVDARYLRERDKLFVSQGVLHRKVTINEQDFQQLVLHQFSAKRQRWILIFKKIQVIQKGIDSRTLRITVF